MSLQEFIYPKLPVFGQHLAVSFYGLYWRRLRFGPGYSKFLDEYLIREDFNCQEWENWQNKKLDQVLKAARATPYYSDNWTELQKKAAISNNFLDLPLLEKEPLRSFPRAFIRSDIHPRRELSFHTSGSTGTPIKSIWTIPEIRSSIALREARSARWADVSFNDPRATFSGRMVEPDPESFTNIYRYNFVEKQVYFSAFHLKPETAHLYVDALRKHKIQWMTGYAVSYYLLAKYILEQNLQVPDLKALITTSEKLTDSMRKVMEEAFSCKVYEEYSTVENALFASECEHGGLHVSPDVSIIEILRPDGSPCDPGEVGEIVTTCLMRTYQPLIRFRLGDLAAWDPDPCPCGRQMPVIKEVVGRIEDVVTGPDGRQLVRFHGIFTDQPNIIEGQIIQESLDEFIVKVVPTKVFSQSDVNDVKERMYSRLGPRIHVDVVKVDKIPRSKSGKFRAVISKVK